MGAEARVVGLSCLRCRARFEEPRLFAGCPRCRAEGVAVNLSVEYDLSPLAGVTPDTLGTTARGVWRFRALLPVRATHPVSLGEGATPLIHLEHLGRRLGLQHLYAKDESQNPTWSDKDRLCATAVTHAVETGARVITISSTGNHGASTAAYAARAGLPCVIFTLASVPETMKTLMQAYGAAVVACPTSESRWELMRQGIERFGWYPTSGFVTPPVGSNPWGVEGYKTIAYEVAEDLGWTAPDVVVVPSAYSDGLYGIWKGWTELQTLGLVKHAPRMIAAEPFGPLAHALERGLQAPEPVEAPAPSVAFSIASGWRSWATASPAAPATAHAPPSARGSAACGSSKTTSSPVRIRSRPRPPRPPSASPSASASSTRTRAIPRSSRWRPRRWRASRRAASSSASAAATGDGSRSRWRSRSRRRCAGYARASRSSVGFSAASA